MMEKIPHTIGKYIFCLKYGSGTHYGISRKYPTIWFSVSVSDLNQNSGFGCTTIFFSMLIFGQKDLIILTHQNRNSITELTLTTKCQEVFTHILSVQIGSELSQRENFWQRRFKLNCLPKISMTI